jgi:hypothetical protein
MPPDFLAPEIQLGAILVNRLKVSFLIICAGSASFAANHNWSTGQVLDANAKRDIVQTGTTFQSSTYGTATATTNGSVANSGAISTVNATTEASGQTTTIGGAQAHHTVFQDNRVIIRGGDYLYTVDDLSLKAVGMPTHGLITRAIANRKHGCRMVVGDPIQYEQTKDKLFVQDADGKVCKLDIVRQERIAKAQSSPK